jgi:hypothetical protein
MILLSEIIEGIEDYKISFGEYPQYIVCSSRDLRNIFYQVPEIQTPAKAGECQTNIRLKFKTLNSYTKVKFVIPVSSKECMTDIPPDFAKVLYENWRELV